MGSRTSNMTFPCVMKVMKVMRINLHICISLHLYSFLCIAWHFSALRCITLHFSAFLCISMNFSAFLNLSVPSSYGHQYCKIQITDPTDVRGICGDKVRNKNPSLSTKHLTNWKLSPGLLWFLQVLKVAYSDVCSDDDGTIDQTRQWLLKESFFWPHHLPSDDSTTITSPFFAKTCWCFPIVIFFKPHQFNDTIPAPTFPLWKKFPGGLKILNNKSYKRAQFDFIMLKTSIQWNVLFSRQPSITFLDVSGLVLGLPQVLVFFRSWSSSGLGLFSCQPSITFLDVSGLGLGIVVDVLSVGSINYRYQFGRAPKEGGTQSGKIWFLCIGR